jgi:hypothetical protein
MNGIFDIASRIATPLALAGFFGAVLFFALRRVLQPQFIPAVRRPESALILLRIINLLFVLCLVGMILGFSGYLLRLRAGYSETPNNFPLPDAAGEQISVQSSRLLDDYDTEVLCRVFVGGHSMPEPAFVRAFWDVMIINNGDRDTSIVSYSIRPFSPDLPDSGPYGEPYAQGFLDFTTDKLLALPLSIAPGHALRLKVRSFVVILPSSIPDAVSKQWEQGLPSAKIKMWDLYYGYFASHGVDFFGNKVSPGPSGIKPASTPELKNQELILRLRTGRGTIQSATLKWYEMDPGNW